MKFFLILCSIPAIGFAQTNYSGRVINKNTKEKISFATIGLVRENIGTTADINGEFILIPARSQTNDTLIVTCVGFKPRFYPVNSDMVIELEEKSAELMPVVVSHKTQWNYAELNQFKNCGNSFVGSSGIQTQLAQHLSAPLENSFLSSVKICRLASGNGASSNTSFRLRIYDFDSATKAPAADLCDTVIEVKAKGSTVVVDLEAYRIMIPNKDFFVAIEWLKITANEHREKTRMLNGEMGETLTYWPSIGWTNNSSSTMEAWMLDYRGKWSPMFAMNNKTSVSISARIKY